MQQTELQNLAIHPLISEDRRMRSDTEQSYRVERVSTMAELAALERPWSRLLLGIPRASIFLTWEWIATWWKHNCDIGELWLLTAWTEDDQLAGIVPWMLVRHSYGSLRRLVFLGSRFSYRVHFDVLASPNEEAAVCRAFLSHLEERSDAWDTLELEGLAEGSVLEACLASLDGRCFKRESLVAPFVRLPATWGQYELEGLSRRRRKMIRRSLRHLEGDYPHRVAFEKVSNETQLAMAFDVLITLAHNRWQNRGLTSAFDNARFVAFHREMARLAMERDWLRLYLLIVDDRVVGVDYGFAYRGVFYGYASGFDTAWGDYSPGHVLQAYVIQQAIAEGARELDLLRGEHDYKFFWTDEAHRDSHITYAKDWRGLSWMLGGVLMERARVVGRELLPAPVRERVNGFLSRARR